MTTPPPAMLPRVMMVVPQYPYPVVGGLERQAHELAKALLELGVKIQVISGVVGHGKTGVDIVEGILVHRVPFPWKGFRFIRTPIDLFRNLYTLRGEYDVIHLHQFSWFGLYTIICAKILDKPIVTKIPNVGKEGPVGILSEPNGRIKLSILLRSDVLVSMSDASLSELKNLGFPLARTLVTPNGISLFADYYPMTRKRDGRHGCRVVFVGRLSEQKQLDVLLHAWRTAVQASRTSAVLEIWGNGPLEGDLRRLSREIGVDNSVIFRGHVDGVRERLQTMDIFVLPSRNEGNSNAILEAMAAGLPIVSTIVGGTSMQVGPEGADFLVQPGDINALADRLGKLIANQDLRDRLGTAMRERVANYFDIRIVARTYLEAYRRLAARRPDLMSEVRNPIILGEE